MYISNVFEYLMQSKHANKVSKFMNMAPYAYRQGLIFNTILYVTGFLLIFPIHPWVVILNKTHKHQYYKSHHLSALYFVDFVFKCSLRVYLICTKMIWSCMLMSADSSRCWRNVDATCSILKLIIVTAAAVRNILWLKIKTLSALWLKILMTVGSTSITPAVGASWWPIPRTPGVPMSLIFTSELLCRLLIILPIDERTQQRAETPQSLDYKIRFPWSYGWPLNLVLGTGDITAVGSLAKENGSPRRVEPQAEVSGADGSLDTIPYKHFPQDPSSGMWWYHRTRNLYKPLGQMVSIIIQNAWMVYDFGCTVLQSHVLQPPIQSIVASSLVIPLFVTLKLAGAWRNSSNALVWR